MSPEKSLLDALQADEDVAALVADRIRFDRADEGDLVPFVVLGREDAAGFTTLSDQIENPDIPFSINCWAGTRLQAEQIADACQQALHKSGIAVMQRTAGYSDEVSLHAAILKVLLD